MKHKHIKDYISIANQLRNNIGIKRMAPWADHILIGLIRDKTDPINTCSDNPTFQHGSSSNNILHIRRVNLNNMKYIGETCMVETIYELSEYNQ